MTQKKQRTKPRLGPPPVATGAERPSGGGRGKYALQPVPGPDVRTPEPRPRLEASEYKGRVAAGREAFPAPTARRRSEETLAALGLETALDEASRLESEGDHTGARALRRWVNTDPAAVLNLLRSLPPTKGGGNGRELRVGMCGVSFVAREGAAVVAARRACKDRLCPTCGERRRRRFAAALRSMVDTYPVQSGAVRRFVTLTQPKVWMEPPRQALRRINASFRKLREGPWGKRYLHGGVRSLEVTARRKGAVVGDYVVKIAGVHAHLHCLVEVDEAGVGCLPAAWARACDGASEGAVDVQDLTETNVYQVGSYVLDMSGMLDMVENGKAGPGAEYSMEAYCREVLAALHGARLVAAFGTWKGRPLGLREPPGALHYGDRSVYTLASNDPENAWPVRFTDGSYVEAPEALRTIRNRSRRGKEKDTPE